MAADMSMPAPIPPPVYMPAPAPLYSWSGFYIGGNGGATWAHSSSTASIAGGLLGGLSASGSSTGSAALGGGQIGANFQYDRFVVGLEGDFDWSGLGNNQTNSCGAGCSGTVKSSLNWLANGRVRAGFVVFDRGLLYGTGGVAVEPLSQNANITIGGVTTNLFNLNTTGVGWTIGAGAEAAVFGNLSAKVEYLYVDVENFNASSPIGIVGGTITQNGRVTQSIVRGGFNYRFNFSSLR